MGLMDKLNNLVGSAESLVEERLTTGDGPDQPSTTTGDEPAPPPSDSSGKDNAS